MDDAKLDSSDRIAANQLGQSDSELNISGLPAGEGYAVRMVPMKDTETRAVSTQGTVKFELNQTGAFSFELIDGKESCTLLSKLDVKCSDGLRWNGQKCTADPCGKVIIDQQPGFGSDSSRLNITLDAPNSKDHTITLIRTDAKLRWLDDQLGQYAPLKVGSWEVQYSSDGQSCNSSALSKVECNVPAYTAADNGTCICAVGYAEQDGQCMARGGTCGIMTIEQGLLNGASASRLHIDIHNAKEPPRLLLSRVDASTKLNGTANSTVDGAWAFKEALKTGQWQIEYRCAKLHAATCQAADAWLCRSGKEVCNTTRLNAVSCTAEYEEAGQGCAAKNKTNLMLRIRYNPHEILDLGAHFESPPKGAIGWGQAKDIPNDLARKFHLEAFAKGSNAEGF